MPTARSMASRPASCGFFKMPPSVGGSRVGARDADQGRAARRGLLRAMGINLPPSARLGGPPAIRGPTMTFCFLLLAGVAEDPEAAVPVTHQQVRVLPHRLPLL